MKKLILALVLAVGLSGNAYPNFITDLFKKKSEKELCYEAVEKGKFITEYRAPEGFRELSSKTYVYNGASYKYYYNNNICVEDIGGY